VEYGACLIVKPPPTRLTEIAFKTTSTSMTLNTSRTTLRAVNTTTTPNSPKSLKQQTHPKEG